MHQLSKIRLESFLKQILEKPEVMNGNGKKIRIARFALCNAKDFELQDGSNYSDENGEVTYSKVK